LRLSMFPNDNRASDMEARLDKRFATNCLIGVRGLARLSIH
jgi:hypothetical protein